MSAASIDIGASSSTQDQPVDSSQPFVLGEWLIDPAQRKATKDDVVVKIDPRNLRVLQILVDRRGEIVSPRDIEQSAWEGVVVTPDSLYQSIRQLRQALGDTKDAAKYIETVPRRGYRLVARVEMAAAKSSSHPEEIARPPSVEAQSHNRFLLSSSVAAVAAVVIVALWVLQARFSDDTASAQMLPASETNVGPLDAPSLKQLGDLALMQGKARDAISYYERGLQVQIASSGREDEMVVVLLSQIASTYLWLDDEVAARVSAEQALKLIAAHPSHSPDRITASTNLSAFMLDLGDYETADSLVDDALHSAGTHYGTGHMASSAPLLVKAAIKHAQGEYSAAERYFREALAIISERRGKLEPRTAYSHTGLAAVLLDSGRSGEAEQHARTALGILERSVRSEHPYVASAQHVLAESLLAQRRGTEAEPVLRAEVQLLESTAASDLRMGRASSALGECLLQLGNAKEAAEYLSMAKQKLKRRKGWPIERELRLLDRRLDGLRAESENRGHAMSQHVHINGMGR